MHPPDPDEFTFRTGVVLDASNATILAGITSQDEERVAHTIVFQWNREDGWRGGLERFGSGSICIGLEPVREVVLLGEQGTFLGISSSTRNEGRVCGTDATPTSVAAVGDRPYVVGMSGLVSRRTSATDWEVMDLGAVGAPDLEAIAGPDDDNFCAVGWEGAIVVREDGVFRRDQAPTNVILTAVCLGGDGCYYVCGQRGVLLRGRGSSWEIIARNETDEDLWDVQWFRGRLFVSSILFVYVLNGEGGLDRADMGDAAIASAYHLHARDDTYLLSVGASDVALFDGGEWITVV